VRRTPELTKEQPEKKSRYRIRQRRKAQRVLNAEVGEKHAGAHERAALNEEYRIRRR
jgi:hypothetical protein